jgi:hypothetical protein
VWCGSITFSLILASCAVFIHRIFKIKVVNIWEIAYNNFMLKILSQKTLVAVGGILIIVLTLIPSVYFYAKYQGAKKMLDNPTEVAKSQAKELVERVGKILELPKDEEPAVATVSDKDKLKDQSFFINAQNGDKVLIYQKIKKAILYRPSISKIIDIAPVNMTPEESQNSTTSAVQASASAQISALYKVVIYNGTKTVGLTKTAESDLKARSKDFMVVDRDDAKSKDYKKTVVVDLMGTNQQIASNLAKIYNAEVAVLPKEELKPKDAEFLVILGSEYFNK